MEQGRERRGEAKQRYGIKKGYKPLCTKQISNQEIIYNLGKYGHSLVITLKRVWSIKNIESLCCTLKINIILQINFNEK